MPATTLGCDADAVRGRRHRSVRGRPGSGRRPGTRWQYSSGTSNLIALAIGDALHDPGMYLTFPRRALFDPIGMSSAVLETDASGTFVGSSCMYATARDWARFGLLYLRDGV